MAERSSEQWRVPYHTMRIAAAMCFIGHGAFGIITKKIWLNYLAVFGIGPDLGYQIMPLVGTVDITLGLSLLFYPTRAVFAWLVVWGTTTALLRPLSGEPLAEAIERAGNYGIPFAVLLYCGLGRRASDWSSCLRFDGDIGENVMRRVRHCLRVVVCLLLVGHGWLNLLDKKGLLDQYASLHLGDPVRVAHAAGWFEIIAALGVLVRPVRPILLGLLAWKMGTELFYPRYEMFEWIERGGSYGAILTLWLVLPRSAQVARQPAAAVA